MSSHECESKACPLVFPQDLGEHGKEVCAVDVVDKELPAIRGVSGYVIDRVGSLYTERAGHEPTVVA